MKVSTQKGLIHAQAECLDCGKEWGWYLTAQKLAYAHARKTGHKVEVETGYSITYSAYKSDTDDTTPS